MAVDITKRVQLRPLVASLLEEDGDLEGEPAAKEALEGIIKYLHERGEFNIKAFHRLVDRTWESYIADYDAD